MPAIRDLHSVRGPLGHPGRVSFRTIPRHDRHLGMGLEPGGDSLGGAVLEQIDRASPIKIHHDGTMGRPFPFGPIVDADGTRPWGRWRGEAPDPAQQYIAAAGHPLAGQVPSTRRAPEGYACRGLYRGQARGGPCVARGHLGDALGERPTPTELCLTPGTANAAMQGYRHGGPWQIGQGAPVVTMDVCGRLGTVRSGGLGSRDGHVGCEAMVLHGDGVKEKGRMRWQETATDLV
jgi:hypothetical protein